MNTGQSAIWGGVTLGIIVGVFRDGFWLTVIYGGVVGLVVGFLATTLGWISYTMRRRNKISEYLKQTLP